MARIFPQAGHIIQMDGARKVWGSDLSPENTVPAATIVVSQSITWPDYPRDFAYGFDRSTNIGNIEVGYCMTVGKVLPHNYMSVPILLGTVPSGVNKIHVSVNMARTIIPAAHLEDNVELLIAEGVDVEVDGFCVVQRWGTIRRAFDINLSGTNVLLTVHQSAADVQAFPWLSNNDPRNQPPREGWTYGSSPSGYPVVILDKDSNTGNPRAVNRGQSEACSTTDTYNFTLQLTGTITIVPARV